MRMTRAALRAQEAGEDLKQTVDAKNEDQHPFSSSKDAQEYLIHEDSDKENSFAGNGIVGAENDEEILERPALRDITEENYPTSLTEPEVVVDNDQSGTSEEVLEKGPKSHKKSKGKKDKKGSRSKDPKANKKAIEQQLDVQTGEAIAEPKDLNAPETMPETAIPEDSQELDTAISGSPTLQDNIVQCLEPSKLEPSDERTEPIPQDTELEGLALDKENVSIELGPETPAKTSTTISKTPRFNPAVHLPIEQIASASLDDVEDSFVDSIKTRSPSKLSQSLSDQQDQTLSNSSADNTATRTPSRTPSQVSSTSPQRIEDSVEAIDALEDAIEKFAEDMPVIQALPCESPVRSRKSPIRTPTKTPAKISAKVATPMLAKCSTTKTPLKTPSALAQTPKFHKKVDLKTSQTPKDRTAPIRKEAVKDRVKAIELKSSPSTHRRTTSAYTAKKDMVESTVAGKPRHTATKSVSSIVPTSTMSFSNSPLKQTTSMSHRRVTSGAPLVTSKPGFAPVKSTKPVTKPTFTLPGEAIAAKLKAQREERQKREEAEPEKKPAFKARAAPTRTAKPSVLPRENKASTARLHVRQASSEDKENVAPRRPSSMVVSSTKPSTASKPKPSVTTSSASTVAPGPRRTTIAPRPTSMIESRKLNLARPTIPPQTSQRITSLTAGQPITASKAEAAQQRVKGREVYGRIKGSVQQLEEEKKAKEDAAKKARAEAAERGRQASREWAEKQKLKMMNAKTNINSESKAVTAVGGVSETAVET